jgi:exodeoxyribonuclease VII large subunit
VPALVQGDEAPKQLIRGLEVVNRYSLGDVIVLARGGGSMEDLWCFNDEALARTIASSKIPVISAVGHEIDFTISDFVSDLRAPTPSAAAEIVSGNWVDVNAWLKEVNARLSSVIVRDLTLRRRLLEHVSARVISPRDRLREQAQRCDDLFMRLERAMRTRLERRRAFMEQWMGKLDALSPLRVLERGYSIVRSDESSGGAVIRSASEVQKGQRLRITFHDGDRPVQVVE